MIVLDLLKKVVLIGDYAEGIDSGLIEILIVGSEINTKYLHELSPKIEKIINRKVRFFVSDQEFVNQPSLVVFEA